MRKKVRSLNESLILDIIRTNHKIKETLRAKGITYLEASSRLGVTVASLSDWLRNRVPALRCKQLSDLIGGEVKPIEMRPDVFGNAAYKPAPREKFLKEKEEKENKLKKELPAVLKKFM